MTKSKAGSLKQAAAMLNLPLDVIKAAVAAGAPGVDDHHRVDLEVFGPWLKENGERIQANVTPTRRIELAEARIAEAKAEDVEHRVAVKKKQFVPLSGTVQRVVKLGTDQKTMLRAKLENELPAKLVKVLGIEEEKVAAALEKIRAEMRAVVDQICVFHQQLVQEWTEEEEA